MIYLTDADRAWQWQPLAGCAPQAMLSRHPSGANVVMQASVPLAEAPHVRVERAAVWDTASRQVVWAPEGANALAWLPNGERILALVESRKQSKAFTQRLTSTPYQSDYSHRCDLYEWPSRQLITSCNLQYPTGWLTEVVPSPTELIAIYVWVDQTEAGFEFLDFSSDRLSQIEGMGYFGEGSNLIQGPVFSSDGAFAVSAYGAGVWWSQEPDEPSPGGELRAGWVAIADIHRRTIEERDVMCHVQPGWLPDDPESIKAEMLSLPVFESPRQFHVTTPNGQSVAFELAG